MNWKEIDENALDIDSVVKDFLGTLLREKCKQNCKLVGQGK